LEPSTRPRERLPRSLLFLYGAPSFAGAAMLVPIYIHLPKFYSDVVGSRAISPADGPDC
jgi:Na+/melibiose symporter-like transporter